MRTFVSIPHSGGNTKQQSKDLIFDFIFRDASVSIQSRCCYLKFLDEGVLPISLHMTNTVFIDRAIIVQPFHSNEIPDELAGLELANQAARTITGENK